MNHEEWQILISAYFDDEVSPEERTQVEAHLETCRTCAAALAEYRRLNQAVRRLPRGFPSRQLWLRVREKLPSRRKRALWWRLVPVASTAALLLFAVTLIIVIAPTMQQPRADIAPALEQPLGYVPASTAAPAPKVESDQAVEGVPPPAAPTAAPEGIYRAALAPCPGNTLGLEVVSTTVTSRAIYDTAAAVPRLRGVLLDAADQPLPGVTLFVSGTVGWWGSMTTDADGAFSLDLPDAGRYRLILALPPVVAENLWGTADAMYFSSFTYTDATEGRVYAFARLAIPEGEFCQVPLLTSTASIDIGPNDETFITLRAR